MKDNYIALTREALERMTTPQLDELLNSELEKEAPNGDTVRLILSVLWEREKDMPVEITPGVEKAWMKYKKQIAKLDAAEKRTEKFRGRILKAASVAAMLGLLVLAVPQQAEADSLFEKLANLTSSIVEFFSPGMANDNTGEYVFETDHPGLQQVYDAVNALGVTDHVVPTWLPEGYELVECKTDATPNKTSVSAFFEKDSDFSVLKYDMYNSDISHEYHWDGENIQLYEHYGEEYSLMRNNGRWVVIWFTDSAECSLTLDCQEDTLYEILDSIYVMEDK